MHVLLERALGSMHLGNVTGWPWRPVSFTLAKIRLYLVTLYGTRLARRIFRLVVSLELQVPLFYSSSTL
jgi:hypothetical protein